MASSAELTLTPEVHTLDNGLSVIAEFLPYVHSVSIGVWIKTGSANEIPAVAGISHFLEHMLFKGTPTRSSRQLMEEIESRGGHMNAFTSKEYTCLYVKILDQHLDVALDVLADIIKHSEFNDFEKERNVILEEIASGIDVPDEHIHDMLSEKHWPEHPLGRPIAGTDETVTNTTLDDIRDYKTHWYCPKNMIVSLVGSFDEATIISRMRGHFGELESDKIEHDWTAPNSPGGLIWEERDVAQNHLAMAFPGTSIVGAGRYNYDMLSSVLGGGSTSRLFDTIREEAGLAYSIYSYNSMYQHAGALGIYAAIAPENLRQTLDLIRDEIKKLQDVPVGADELNSNREQLKGGLLLALEGTFSRMTRMARSLMFHDRVTPIPEILEHVDAVTAEDIQLLAQKMFSDDTCTMAILGPRVFEGDVALGL
ncbi:MAG: pitrilysin family protein [Candidatus Hydrogenedentota bacterium]